MKKELFKAVISGNISEVISLIKLNINVNSRDMLGKTALHYAIEHNYKYITKLLLEKGACPNTIDLTNSEFPLEKASDENIIILLKRAGASTDIINQDNIH